MIQPLHDRVLLKQTSSQEEKTPGGIYIPDSAKDEATKEGEVIEVGQLKDITLTKGDKVLYEPHAGTDIKINGQVHVIVKAEDIIAKVTD